MTWAQDWPWIVGILAVLAWFTFWEARGLRDGAQTHTLSRFVSGVFSRFPLSIGIVCMIIGGLLVHFSWHWCPDLGQGIGRLLLSPAYGAELQVRDLTLADPVLTPGVSTLMSVEEICARKWGLDRRHVTEAMKREVFKRYGLKGNADRACIRDVHGRRCEVDHLISRELGGADEVLNLWPQPYGSSPWNAVRKDRVENRLHKEVCAGNITIDDAQYEIRSDYRVPYRRYFGDPEQE